MTDCIHGCQAMTDRSHGRRTTADCIHGWMGAPTEAHR